MLAAAAILLVFFGGFGTWAVLVPLSGAAIAPAVVAPEGFRKTIQHLEGGIVSEIRVQEGSQVEAGDVIVVLDDTRARADYNGCPGAVGLHARPQRPTGGRADRRGNSRVRRRSGRGGGLGPADRRP